MAPKPTYEDLRKRIMELEKQVAELRQTETAISITELWQERIFNSLEEAVLVVTPDRKLVNVNDGAVRMFGYSSEELTSLSTAVLHVDQDHYMEFGKIIQEAFDRGQPANFEFEAKRKNGEVFPSEHTVTLLKGDQGEQIGIVSVVRDITERKQHERELEKRVEERTAQLTKTNEQLQHEITERKGAEEALRESEELHKEAQRVAHIGHWELYPEIGTPVWSDEIFRIFGLKPQEGEPSFTDHETHLHPDDWPLLNRAVTLASTEGTPFDIIFRIVRPDGEIRWMHGIGTTTKDEKGKVIKLFGTAQDITDLKQAEEALRESEKKYGSFLNNLVDGAYESDDMGNLTYANEAAVKIVGKPLKDIVGKPFLPLFTKDSQTKAVDVYSRSLSGEDIGPYELELTNGTVCQFKNALLKDKDGKIVGVFGIMRDISKQKWAEEALRESEERYRTVLESNPDPVVVYDIEGKVIYLNPAFTRVFGWSLEEQIGKKIDNFVPEENWPETRMLINKVTVSGESFSGFETRRYTKEGNILDISISGSFYRDQEEDVAASVINLRDITEQKRLEGQLQQAQKMEAIVTLAGGIAHNFNNALTPIIGNIDLLEMAHGQDEKTMGSLKDMKTSGLRMAHLTSQLLAYAEGGKYNPQIQFLSDFVDATLPLIQHTLDPAVRVETDLPLNVKDVKADSTQMQMILSAIMANSNEAMEGPGRIRISTRNRDLDQDFIKDHPDLKPGPYVCLSIEDDGKGMDEETRNRIFDPFFTTHFMGRGLGMASVYGIVKNHDGAITVESELGKGTVVSIYLPAIEAEEKPKKAVVSKPEIELPTGDATHPGHRG